MTRIVRSVGLLLGLSVALAPQGARAWQSGAFATLAGPPTCMAWETVYSGTALSFTFKPTGFVLRLTNQGWDLPRDGLHPSTIWSDGRQLAAGTFKAKSATVLEAQFDYATAPGFMPAVMNALELGIQFPAYRYEADLAGLYPALYRLTPCVVTETGGYDPFH